MNQITHEMLSNAGFVKTKNIVFYKDEDRSVEDPFDERILTFLIELKNIADECNTNGDYDLQGKLIRHDVNYEDLISMLYPIKEHLTMDFSPYGKMLLDRLTIDPILKYCVTKAFLQKVGRYIVFTVKRMLRGDADTPSAFDGIVDYCKNSKSKIIDIFTLNHDVLLENILRESDIHVIDGFGNIDGDLRKWNPELLDNCDIGNIRLLKLHGSIDWQIFRASDLPNKQLGIYVGPFDINHDNVEIRDAQNTNYESRPDASILIGAANKINEYYHLHFWDLHYRFRKMLRENDCLIVVGYGFRDSAINSQILEWLQNENNKKMVIIDIKNVQDFSKQMGYVFRWNKRWDNLVADQKVVYISGGIQSVSLDEDSINGVCQLTQDDTGTPNIIKL